MQLAFSQQTRGRRVGARCARATAANRTKRPCDREETRGTLNIAGRVGENAASFRGRVGGRTLAPGRYRLRVTARADGRRSAAATIAFTIAR